MLRSCFIFIAIMVPTMALADIDSDLLKASKKGDLNQVKVLLDKGANLNAREHGFLADSGNTPLILASAENHAEVAEELINRGSGLDVTNLSGNTALMYAAWKGHRGVIKLLLDHGANVNLKDNSGQSPLYIAIAHGPRNIGILKELLDRGSVVDAKKNNGRTPLFEAVNGNLVDEVKVLLKHGADSSIIIPEVEMDVLAFAQKLLEIGKSEFKEVAQLLATAKESHIKEAKENARKRLQQAQREEEEKRARVKAQRHLELVSQHGEEMAVVIEKGKVREGMTTEAVIAVRGKPSRREKIPPSDELWFYGAKRVAFTDGKVTYVGH